jgi:hypothetical protein
MVMTSIGRASRRAANVPRGPPTRYRGQRSRQNRRIFGRVNGDATTPS